MDDLHVLSDLKKALVYIEKVKGNKLTSFDLNDCNKTYARGFESALAWAIEVIKMYVPDVENK